MKKLLFLTYFMIGCILISLPATASITVEFPTVNKKVIKEIPDLSTGLDAVFVVFDMADVGFIELNGILSGNNLRVQKYSNLGGGYAVDVPVSFSTNTARIYNPEGDMGYMVEDGNNRYNFWVVNYAGKHLKLSGVEASQEQDCDITNLMISGEGSAIHYFSINGRQCILSRGIEVKYTTLEWEENLKQYNTVDKTAIFEYLQNRMSIRPAFLCNTSVIVSGDRFMHQWEISESLESGIISANGLEVHTFAIQTNAVDEDSSQNMIKGDESLLGGSAPADFTFYAYPSDAVIHNEWQIADDADFEYIKYRFNEQDLTYTFDQEGRYFVRYIGSNSDGSCETYGDTYEIGIGASDLRIPNAFSPDGDGVNDIWKVGYRSLTEFKCWIFDRNGRQLFYFDRPDQGWDGRYKGKTVSSGVYYYVIEAKGADGVKYKKGGDINIIGYRKLGNSSSNVGE